MGRSSPGDIPLITVHHLRSGEPFVVNAELIEVVEAAPDTHLTLTTGRKLLARETPAEIVALVVEYRRRCHQALRVVTP